jgi:uncharacterized membrane-anchored protein YhcB (DUF1043 family)
MEGQIALWMWIAAAAFFITGLLMGMALSRSHEAETNRVKELEAEVKQNREEAAKYREQVAHHFTQTADLLHTMTANYRAVYEHLADGAQNLCAGQVRSLTPAALRERLLSTNHTEHTDTAAADLHAAPPKETEQEPAPEQDSVKAETDAAPAQEEKQNA